ncbi:hypothetical protein HOD05_01705 [Candidatus Woesearchaeota archaeon]|jgi:uncharacterized protein (UPF0147 family)|nr:hypothetical protein [Candidatus Woesearchaeota archaeon]MBT4151133.1 hypothetical protein [Candidatus Woesearchaeota archaeon]MBT4247951.1 hypothetical protein [Candidatus Woesearchaeota archaeon]MBT4433910.1 hypothetical protein [Candidatus Woesearchaeota archaeon]MBT7332081.1 hypothetical protein [Candidatus Woesearchaeota archaeon]
MNNELLQEALGSLEMLQEDDDASKRIKEKANKVITLLNSQEEMAISKALMELEELNSNEISSYLRTQVWDIVSLLESAKN